MSAKTGGSLATVVMSIPLAAIPLMAIFGIPQFTEVVASPDDTGRDLILGSAADPGEPGNPDSYRQRASDLFDDAPAYATRESLDTETLGNPFDAPENAFDGMIAEPSADPDHFGRSDSAGGADWSQPPLDAGQGTSPQFGHSVLGEESSVASISPTSPGSGPQVTWRAATRRLQELGIDDYHLERGESFESFLFVCSFEPAGTANVVMRFEAEADEPLTAVTDVLDQIDRWLRRSFAESRQAALLSEETAQ